MPRFQRLASDSLHPRLWATCIAAFLCLGSAHAAKPVVMEELDAIDTTFGEDQPMPPPVPAQADTAAADVADPATSAAPSVPEAMEPTEPTEDGAFENIVDPGDVYRRNWTLDFRTSLGGPDPDTTTKTVWVCVSRRFENEVESFVPRAGWMRTSEAPDDFASHLGVFGATVTRLFPMDITASLDAEWKTQEGRDAWSASADLSWTRELADLFELSASWASGWSNVSRTLHQASIGLSAGRGSWTASAEASWKRRWQEYHFPWAQWRSEYVHAWGWSTSLLWTTGSWTTGPTWSGEYWKTNSWVDTTAFSAYWYDGRSRLYHAHYAPRSRSVSSDGVAVDQTLSWTTSWKPIESLRLELDISRSFGLSDATTRPNDARSGLIATSTVDAYLPPDSWGGTFGFSFDW